MIRWISENLGTSSYEYAKDKTGIYILDVRDMVDKIGNNESIVSAKIKEAISEIKNGKRVVICCDYGMSRSNSIAIGVHSILNNLSINDAVADVTSKTGIKEVKPEVLSVVYSLLNKTNKQNDIVRCNILVTGASGFIGNRIAALLKKNNNVFAPSRVEIDLLVDILAFDLYVKQNNISTIIHLANPRVYNTVSAMGESLKVLRNILTVCSNNNIHIIYMSCWEVYSGYRSSYLLASEELPLLAKGVYGETKYLCEKLLSVYGRCNPLKYTIIRSSPVYGTGSDRPKFIYNFIDKAIKNQQITTHNYANGLPCLDLLYIDDLEKVLVEIVNSGKTGEFNIGTGLLASTFDIAKMIINIIESKSKIKTIDVASYWANIAIDSTKVRSLFEWVPRINTETGIRMLIDDYFVTKDEQNL